MKSFSRIVALFGAVLLCGASAVSYRESYREQDLGRNRHLITTRANGYNDDGDAHQYAFTRAKELCPYGFDVVSQDGQAVGGHGYGNQGAVGLAATLGSEKHEVSLVVQCLPPESPVAPVAQTAARAPGAPAQGAGRVTVPAQPAAGAPATAPTVVVPAQPGADATAPQ